MRHTQEMYALGNDRSARFARSFLEHFLPSRESFHADYPVPENADEPIVTFETDDEILKYLAVHPEEPYGLYWNDASAGSCRQAMLFYTRDGKIIFGLAEMTDNPEERLAELARFVGASFSRLGSEQRPPSLSTEFIEQCEVESQVQS